MCLDWLAILSKALIIVPIYVSTPQKCISAEFKYGD